MKYFVGTELGVAHFLQRHFDWIANALWYEEIPQARDPRKTMFFLGGKDAIVDASVSSFLLSNYAPMLTLAISVLSGTSHLMVYEKVSGLIRKAITERPCSQAEKHTKRCSTGCATPSTSARPTTTNPLHE